MAPVNRQLTEADRKEVRMKYLFEVLVNPALLFFVKFYEERDLELCFDAYYLAYRSGTPMLFPRKPAANLRNQG